MIDLDCYLRVLKRFFVESTSQGLQPIYVSVAMLQVTRSNNEQYESSVQLALYW